MRRLASVPLLLLVFGCAIGPDYKKPEPSVPQAWKEASEDSEGLWQEARPQDAVARGAWWEIFSDQELNVLEVEAIQSNQSLESAVARLERARAAARLPKADLMPELTFNPSLNHFQRSLSGFGGAGSLTNDNFDVPLDLSYEVDLWGKVRRSFEAAHAEAKASEAAYETVLLSVTAEVARTYFQLRALDAELEALRKTVDLRHEAQRLIQARVDTGLSSDLEVARVTAEVHTAEAESLDVERRRAEFEHALAVLCGRTASEFSLPARSLKDNPPAVPLGIPSRVLERRPDVAEAERQMAATNARIGVAKAAYFPVLKLAGSAGWSSAKAEDLITADSLVWSIGPSLSIPILSGGKADANLRIAEAGYREAVSEYRRRVLVAFQEVEDALVGIRLLKLQQQAQDGVLSASREAAALSLERFTQGLVNFLEVVDAERQRLDAERRAAQIRGQRMAATILLIKALGGGWGDAPAALQQVPSS